MSELKEAQVSGTGAGKEHAGRTSPANGGGANKRPAPKKSAKTRDPFIRAESEDDDGYDPYSDRRPKKEPLFERDPWS